MRYRGVWVGALAYLIAATVVPLAAPAQSTLPSSSRPAYALDIPEGWGTILKVGTEERWIPPDENALVPRQFIRITATGEERDVETYAAQMMNLERSGGAEIVDQGRTTACEGQPAHHWIARAPANSGSRIEEYALVTAVTNGVGLAQYVHPQGETLQPDALAVLASLCPAPFAMPRIDRWTGYPTTPAGYVKLNSPDGASTFYGSYRRLAHARFPNAHHDPRATVIKSWNETCADGELIRTDLRRGATTLEAAWGYLRGYSYVFTYEHPAATPPDPAAERALTSICRDSALPP